MVKWVPREGQAWEAVLGLDLSEDPRVIDTQASQQSVGSRVWPVAMGLSPHSLWRSSLISGPLTLHPERPVCGKLALSHTSPLPDTSAKWSLGPLRLEWQVGSLAQSQCSVICCFSPVGDSNPSSSSGPLAVASGPCGRGQGIFNLDQCVS